MSDRPVTLEFIAQQQAQIIAEQANQRADMNVLIALINRLDTTIAALTGEVRALHGQISRFRLRVEQLEGRP